MTPNRTLARWLALSTLMASAAAQAITVLGTSDFKLAGMPDGASASSGDVAPGQSPVLALEGLVAGSRLAFHVSTIEPVGNCSGCTVPTPDGGGAYGTPSENGIAGLVAPINSLVGVFLGSDVPSATGAPIALDFNSAASIDFASLAPELKQSFFIGDGLTSGGQLQSFVVPQGATRLYLGTMDGYGWLNNVGAYEVSISAVPEPSAALLLGGGVMALVWSRKKKGQPR